MPAYNFMARFAPLVESGEKCQTIRQTDKGAKPGDTAYLYTGQRTKQCRKLGEGMILSVLPIKIARLSLGEPYAATTTYLVGDRLDDFSKADGFAGGEEMVAWFEKQYGLPFFGYLHQWELLDKPKEK